MLFAVDVGAFRSAPAGKAMDPVAMLFAVDVGALRSAPVGIASDPVAVPLAYRMAHRPSFFPSERLPVCWTDFPSLVQTNSPCPSAMAPEHEPDQVTVWSGRK